MANEREDIKRYPCQVRKGEGIYTKNYGQLTICDPYKKNRSPNNTIIFFIGNGVISKEGVEIGMEDIPSMIEHLTKLYEKKEGRLEVISKK